MFISYLFQQGFAASTITSTISAISFVHKLCSLQDPTTSFLIKKLLSGAYNMRGTLDSRLPIDISILSSLIINSSKANFTHYMKTMFNAMCTLAFHAFLRIGEFCITTSTKLPHLIQLKDISVITDSYMVITIRHFKHNHQQRPVSLNITTTKQTACPVWCMQHYLKLRGQSPGPLFINPDGTPVHRLHFTRQLKLVLSITGHNPANFNGHSFRIGAASTAAAKGLSDAQIQYMGRWNTNAFRRYIRIPTLSVTQKLDL